MHTLRPNSRRRFTHFPHLGRPPCRSGNSQPAKNASPPFYVSSAVFLTPSIKPAPPFYAFPAPRKTSLSVGKFPTRKEYFAAVLRPLSRFSHSVDKTRSVVLRILRLKELPKKEKRRGISATDTPLSPTPRSLQCGLYPTRLDSTRIYHQSQRLFTNKIPLDKTRALSTLFVIPAAVVLLVIIDALHIFALFGVTVFGILFFLFNSLFASVLVADILLNALLVCVYSRKHLRPNTGNQSITLCTLDFHAELC